MFTSATIFPEIKIDPVRKTKELNRVLGQIIRETAREYLRSFITNVPVETGMAAGAFKPLGAFLHTAVPISPSRAPYYSKLEGGEQNISFGAAKSDFEVVSDSSSLIYTFTWTTQVIHYYVAQYYNGTAMPADEAESIAKEAAQDYAEWALANRLPKWAQQIFTVEFS